MLAEPMSGANPPRDAPAGCLVLEAHHATF